MMEVLRCLIRIKSPSIPLHLTDSAITSSITLFTKIQATRFDASHVSIFPVPSGGEADIVSFFQALGPPRFMQTFQKLVSVAPALDCG